MPYSYRKSYPSRTRGYRRKSYSRRLPKRSNQNVDWAQVASRAYTMGKYAMGVLNSEKKNYDYQMNTTPSTSGTVISPFTSFAKGTDNNSLTGNSIRVKRWSLFGSMTIHASGTSTRLRVICFTYKDPRGSVPAGSDVLANVSVSGMWAREAALGQYHILYDKQFLLSTTTGITEMRFRKSFKMSKKVVFDDSTNIVKNGFYVLLVSDEATNTPTFNVYSRVLFYDN